MLLYCFIAAASTELFRAWDENSDGFVSKREFRRGVQLFGLKATTSVCNDLYSKFDKNNDGKVSPASRSVIVHRQHLSSRHHKPC